LKHKINIRDKYVIKDLTTKLILQREMREKVEREGVERGRSLRRNLHGVFSRHGGSVSEKGKGFVHHLDRTTTSFFFTNFPMEAKVVELWSLFNKFGKVGEVYIPNKLDKKGQRFGFVKFKEVTDAREMEARLENVWWESYKLRINLSRFNRGAKVVTQPKAHGGGLQKKDNLKENKGRIDNVFVENGKSFKNVLIKEGVNAKLKSPSATPADTLEEKQKSLVVCVQDDLLKKLQASFVGFLVDAKDVVKVNEGLVMEGYGWNTATFMGGNMVLLSSKTP
jgi:RNA recognition motif-containing protein